MFKTKQKYYTSDDHFRFREIRWFGLKVLGIIAGSVIILVASIVAVNDFYYDVLGMGYNEVTTLQRDNTYLKQKVKTLMRESENLQTQLDELHKMGNDFRLLVDLPTVDNETKEAGVGGSVTPSMNGFVSDDVADILENASSITQQLRSEVSVQQQNYREIFEKYRQNKDFFAAVPALKPMEGSYSPTGFGVRMHPVLGVFKSHDGLDIINDVGTPIYAAGGGVVQFGGHSGGGFGNVVIINHGYGYQTVYAHLSKVLVREGQRVRRGDLIAKSGKSGLVSGPHLHYEVHYKGVRQNPADYFMDDIHPGEYQQLVAAH